MLSKKTYQNASVNCHSVSETESFFDITQAYSFVTVYCSNFIILCLSPLNYFPLVSCPSSHQILATPLSSILILVWLSPSISISATRYSLFFFSKLWKKIWQPASVTETSFEIIRSINQFQSISIF